MGAETVRATLLACSLTVVAVAWRADAADTPRQTEVSERGARVMPFSLKATTHVFTKTKTGGVQEVLVKDRGDNEQVWLIRQHLREVAERFGRGDFSAPTEIHGQEMPGLAALKNAMPGEIAARYRDLADGGRIEYSTRNASLVRAIHRWFDAQLSDHGADASAGHQHHHDHMMKH